MNTHLEILVKELIKNGVSAKCCEIITDFHGNPSASEPFLDFSEHDKMVAEEKDKRIEELEKALKADAKRIVELIAEKNELKREKFDILKINLNDRIKVKLTPAGAKIYYHQFDETNRRYGKMVVEPKMPKIDKDGYTEFQLWGFIELYGEYIGAGKENVIEPLDIVII